MKKLITSLSKLQGFLVVLAVVAVVGLTLRDLAPITNVAADPNYQERKKEELVKSAVKIDVKTVDALKGLVSAGESVPVPDLTKVDPLTP